MSHSVSVETRKRLTMKRLLVFAVFSCTIFLTSSAAAQCLQYEPKAITLAGVLRRETHAGPPNYESIRRGDKPETIWVLRLTKSICVAGTDDINVKEENQTELQLVLAPDQFRKYQRLIGQRVVVNGTLFHAHTGHHHKTLLITVSEIKRQRM